MPTIELGIDEFTIVLQLPVHLKHRVDPVDWHYSAENIISVFSKKADLQNVFGIVFKQPNAPNGYTDAITYGEHLFYFAVAYHQFIEDMGVIVKFSAQALDYYLEKTGLNAYELLKCTKDSSYELRCSRIDLTADYIDEDLDVTAIYQDLIDNRVGLFRNVVNKNTGEVTYRRINLEYSGFIKRDEVPTIYIGSAQSNCRLRIYDKRKEQIEKYGTKYDKAQKCCNWVRFEGVFRHEYAHQLTDALLHINNDLEYCELIASTLVQKFQFFSIDNGAIDCETEYTQALIDVIGNQSYILKAPASRRYDFLRSLIFLLHGSGLMSAMYKIKEMWGDKAVQDFLLLLKDFLDEWEPNDDCLTWLRKNKADYGSIYSDFDDFKKRVLLPYL